MTFVEQLIIEYKNKYILVDTNLLILLFIGNYDIHEIEKNKRTTKYTQEDYYFLIKFLSNFKLIMTPNILTELTDLCKPLNAKTSFSFFYYLAGLIQNLQEIYICSSEAIKGNSFIKFDLSDSVISYISNNGFLVLTDDLDLYGFLVSQNRLAINFNHLRTEYMLN
jgi:hypothetical protein